MPGPVLLVHHPLHNDSTEKLALVGMPKQQQRLPASAPELGTPHPNPAPLPQT